MPRITNIQARKGTAADWLEQNPVLASGELGYDLTNKILKLGDGNSSWNNLSSINLSSSNITDFNSAISGVLPVKNISAGSNITISSVNGVYTISSTGGGGSSSNVGVRGIINTTGTLSSFAVSGGYPVGYLDLFQDGVKLVSNLDFSATDGSNVTLSNSVPSGTVLEYLTMASGVSAGGGSLSGSVTIPNLGDLSYSSVSLLLHGEGSNGSTTVTDNSASPKTISLTGNAQISTSQAKFGSSSIYLPSSSSISIPSSSDFAFGTGDFTVEFWWYVTALPTSEARLVYFGDTPNQFLNLSYGNQSYTFSIVNESVAHIITTTQSVSLNQWHHIAYTRSSNTLYLFFNGTLLGSTNIGGISTPTTNVLMFPGPGGSSYFDDIRITKGVARYTSAFSPPTAVFADASSLTLPVTVTGSSGSSGSSYDSRWDLFLPPAPTGLTASAGNTQATVSWTAPTVLSQTPITDYIVQYSSNSGSTWTTFSDGTSTSTSTTVTGLSNGTSYTFRVAAVNGIGTGSYSSASSSVTPSSFSASAVILTTGTSYTVPSGASSMKVWAVGPGGQDGGARGHAGAVAYKTWSVSGGESVSYAIGQRSVYSGSYSRSGSTTVTFGGTTITAEGGGGPNGPDAAATYSGGDGGANGGQGGYVNGNNAGGAVGGNGTLTECGRYPATDVSGLFSAVTMAGGSVTESCGATAAFGSGGSAAASSLAGIGGGGAWYGVSASDDGGPGAVVIYFS